MVLPFSEEETIRKKTASPWPADPLPGMAEKVLFTAHGLPRGPGAQVERQVPAGPVRHLPRGEAHRPHLSPLFPGPAAFLNDYVSMYVPKIFG